MKYEPTAILVPEPGWADPPVSCSSPGPTSDCKYGQWWSHRSPCMAPPQLQ